MISVTTWITSLATWFVAFIILTPLLLWLWALVDVLRSPFQSDLAKLLVIVLMFCAPFFGPILYFIFKRRILNLT